MWFEQFGRSREANRERAGPIPPRTSPTSFCATARRCTCVPSADDDGAGLLALYDRLSSESLYFRFFAVPDKDAGKAEYLTHVDYDRRYAVVAETEGAIVGVARWECSADRPSHAEVAFTVADAFQGRGLGALLFRRLAALARTRRITVFEAEVLKNNERMLRLFARTGLPSTTRDQGSTLTILLALDPSAPPPA